MSAETTQQIRKTVQEANRHFLLTYLDANGFPHSSYMGFAHLNRNYSVILLIREDARKALILQDQPWIELVFPSRDFRTIVKFFGKAILQHSPPTVQKLLAAYPVLADYFDATGSGCLVVQLQTQVIEVESLPENGKWHVQQSYMIENGGLVAVDKPVLQGASLGAQEKDDEAFDSIRRQITKNHGEMLMALIHQDFDALMQLVAPGFSGSGLADADAYRAQQVGVFQDLDLGNAEINWGLRDFEQKRDGSVVCQYFLDIVPQSGEQLSVKQQETWTESGGQWQLFRIE